MSPCRSWVSARSRWRSSSTGRPAAFSRPGFGAAPTTGPHGAVALRLDGGNPVPLAAAAGQVLGYRASGPGHLRPAHARQRARLGGVRRGLGFFAATCATVGKIAVPQRQARGYDMRLTLGALAASGSLGLMIPPSIIMIVDGVAAEVSISRLFIAGVVPGLRLVGLFMAYAGLWSPLSPARLPVETAQPSGSSARSYCRPPRTPRAGRRSATAWSARPSRRA